MKGHPSTQKPPVTGVAAPTGGCSNRGRRVAYLCNNTAEYPPSVTNSVRDPDAELRAIEGAYLGPVCLTAAAMVVYMVTADMQPGWLSMLGLVPLLGACGWLTAEAIRVLLVAGGAQ